ncbi:hypothetical protein RRG08_052489 [Elysia crispata]|uniref:VWFC domain-containing protein n=1 Tax=Elysia crispata TaxID=231223 RepID=A0AAE1B2B7_9GAST|nr:hypothetical protein RRG08_052489 [Elysia crispata]
MDLTTTIVFVLISCIVVGSHATSSASNGTCNKDGVEFAVGTTYKPSPCTACSCSAAGAVPNCGQIFCEMMACPEGYRMYEDPNECCPLLPVIRFTFDFYVLQAPSNELCLNG